MSTSKFIDRELDRLIATKVMQWTLHDTQAGIRAYDGKIHASGSWSWQKLPYFASSRDDAAVVLERIRELGLHAAFVNYLSGIPRPLGTIWDLLTATPRQLCVAALACVGVSHDPA